ncbi:MAG: hypothetical protein K0R15_76 [Clostridiales bacterium]|jgi:hypothetical protein|nr:hypothetical protein [Clostridiales bacterium]
MEAIVSVAIAGIIIVPLGLIFYQALSNISISKENLKMTQLAQNYIEYTKSVSIDETNGFEIPVEFTEENEADSDFYYEKRIEGVESIERKYNVVIKVFPNFYTLDGSNEINYSEQFSAVYERADTSKFAIPELGDISGNRRIDLIYEEVEDNPDQINISYSVYNDLNPFDNLNKTQTYALDELNGEFVLFYKTSNFDPESMSDLISIYNRTHLNLTLYVLKDMNISTFPEVALEEGYATTIKDTIFEGANNRRIYKIVVSVEAEESGKEIVVEATKNEQY